MHSKTNNPANNQASVQYTLLFIYMYIAEKYTFSENKINSI